MPAPSGFISGVAIVFATMLHTAISSAATNPDFEGNSPPPGWTESIDGGTQPVLVEEGDTFTLSIDQHVYDFCTDLANPDDCISRIQWGWYNRTYYNPRNNGDDAWSVTFEIVDPDNDCRQGQDYDCTIRVTRVTNAEGYCGYPWLGNVSPILIDYHGDLSPGIPNTRGLPYVILPDLYLDVGDVTCPPVAEFVVDTPDVSSGDDPFLFRFDGRASYDPDNTNATMFWASVPDSAGISLWEWDFGDGTIDYGETPSHSYAEPGIFDVTLTVTDDESEFESITNSVDVVAEISAMFTARASQDDPYTIEFDGSASSSRWADVVSWDWNFGDGIDSPDDMHASIAHTYAEPGSYDVTLYVRDDVGNEGEQVQSVTVGSTAPVALASFQRDPDNPLRVFFDGSASHDPDDGTDPGDGIATLTWVFGDGAADTIDMPEHDYPMIASYVASLTVTDDERETATVDIPVDLAYEVTASVGYAAGSNPLQLTFDGTSSTTHRGATIVSWTWQFGDGMSGDGPTPVHRYDAPGTYPVTLTVVDDFVQSAVVEMEVVVDGLDPVAIASGGILSPGSSSARFDGSASHDPDDGDSPGSGIVAWDWHLGDGGTASGAMVEHTYERNGTYDVQLTVTDNEGRQTSTGLVVTVDTAGDVYRITFTGQILEQGREMIELIHDGLEGTFRITRRVESGSVFQRICGGTQDCLVATNAQGTEATYRLRGSAVSAVSCLENPQMALCGLHPALDQALNGIQAKLNAVKTAATPFQLRAIVPPGGGLPTYAANRREAGQLRNAVASMMQDVNALEVARRLSTQLQQRIQGAVTPPDPQPVILRSRVLGMEISFDIGPLLSAGRTVVNVTPQPENRMNPLSALCQKYLGSATCGIDLTSSGSNYGGLLGTIGPTLFRRDDTLAKSVYRDSLNSLSRSITRIGNQVGQAIQRSAAQAGSTVDLRAAQARRIDQTAGDVLEQLQSLTNVSSVVSRSLGSGFASVLF